MKKTYKIVIDCANCANLMQDAVQRVPGIQSASINFMTQKMTVEFAADTDEHSVMHAVVRACKKVEPDCEIIL